METRQAYAFVDGGCRPNPGRAVSAALIVDSFGNTIAHRAKDIGDGTNVTAEWGGVILALETARELGVTHLTVCGDNELVMSAAFGDSSPDDHRDERRLVQSLREGFVSCTGHYIPRERNAAADYLCDSVFDGTYRPFTDLPAGADDLVDFSYVIHVRVPSASYRERTERNALKASITRALRTALPVASVSLKRVF